MLLDVLKLVEPLFRFTEIVKNIRKGEQWVKQYVTLTDGIIERIEVYDEDHPIFKDKPQLLKDLQTAKTILNSIKSRRIYRFVREVQTAISEETL